MAFEEFGALLSEICAHTPLAKDRPLSWTIIANPQAGGFTIKSRWKKHKIMLEECLRKARENPQHAESGPSKTAVREGGENGRFGLIATKARGHAAELCRALVDEAASANANSDASANASASASTYGKRPFHLIITAGGDGTSLEVMTSLFYAADDVRKDFVILRLPMGTGNDGSDTWELDKALELIIKPSELRKQRALQLSTSSGKGPFLAFNVLSVGLCAFVTHMTNKMKGKLPGDSYKLWLDIASLFYDRVYKVDVMDVRAKDAKGNEVKALSEKLLLLAVGESGRRTYGSHKWILPDERNVCAVRQMPLLRKVALKELLNTGGHVNKNEAILWNADSVEFSARHPLLAQMDGETVLLKEEDYPAKIELTPPVIPILKLKTPL